MFAEISGVLSNEIDLTIVPFPYKLPVLESNSVQSASRGDMITVSGRNFTDHLGKGVSARLEYRVGEGSTPIEEAHAADMQEHIGEKVYVRIVVNAAVTDFRTTPPFNLIAKTR